MAIAIDERFKVDAPLETVWTYFSNPPQVVPCLPGARLTEVVDETTYKGTVTVKVGPVQAEYAGTVHVDALDSGTHFGRLTARGDQKGAVGRAEASVSFRLRPVDDSTTEVDVEAQISATGRIMRLGGGMIQTVSRQLFRSFSECAKAAVENEARG